MRLQPLLPVLFAQRAEYDAFFKDYTYIKGANAILIRQTDNGTIFECTGPFGKFESLYIDGTLVDPTNYDKSEGSTIIELHQNFVDSLQDGKHSFRTEYTDGSADTVFYVKTVTEDAKADGKGSGTAAAAANGTNIAAAVNKNLAAPTATKVISQTAEIQSPATGDASNAGAAGAAFAAALGAAVAAAFARRKYND